MITREQIKNLENDQVVRYRIGRIVENKYGGGKSDWEPWKKGKIYVQKHKGNVVIIVPRNEYTAEYSPKNDFDQGLFVCEDFLFEIDGDSLP